MVRPTTFGFNPQAAQTNAYMHKLSAAESAVRDAALAEFDGMVEVLRAHDIEFVVWDDVPKEPLPDAVFPNNWLTTWQDGSIFLYPMAPVNRRGERRPEIIARLSPRAKCIDLSKNEHRNVFLEGTGVMVFDHVHKIAYAGLSPRCDRQLFVQHAHELGYRPLAFHTKHNNAPVYHLNIVMAVQPKVAVLCSDLIADKDEKTEVLRTLEQTGHTVIQITPEQMMAFCANVLCVKNKHGDIFVVMSQGAHDAFTPAQRKLLAQDGQLLAMPLPTIEQVGGGSARCMLAEVCFWDGF